MSSSVLEVLLSYQHNSAEEPEKNINRINSDETNFTLADVYDVEYYEKIMSKSICDVPNITLPDVSAAAVYENNLHSKPSGDKYKRVTTNKNYLSDSPDDNENNLHLIQSTVKRRKYTTNENDSSDSSDDYENNLHLKQSAVKRRKYTTNKNDSSDSSDDYEKTSEKNVDNAELKKTSEKNVENSKPKKTSEKNVRNSKPKKTSEKNVENSKPKKNVHYKQSSVKNKKYTANKNDSSDELEILSSDSSDSYGHNLPSPDSSDEWEMHSPVPSDESEMHSPVPSDELEMHSPDSSDEYTDNSNISNKDYDSCDSSDDYEASEKKKKYQKSKKALKRNVKESKPKKEKLSEYEKMIQKNRDEKLAFLKTLRIDEVKENLNEAIKKIKPKRILKKKKEKDHNRNLSPIRKSVRLEKVAINLSEEALEARARAKAEKKDEIVMKLPSFLRFEEAITEDNVYANFARDFDDLEFMTPEPFTDYVSCFEIMKIEKYKVAQVFDRKVHALAFHPMKEKVIVSAGDSCGAIGVWHVNSESVPYVFKPHLNAVSCLKFNPDSENQIISCSFDGTMRCGDMEKKVFNEVFNASNETACNYFDFISPTTTVVCHRSGNVSLVDIRSRRTHRSHRCHDSSVTTVNVHPVNKSYFVSADTKGFLSLWDLRNLQKKPVTEVHHYRKHITSAFFSPVTGNSILTSADDSLCLFDCSKLGSALYLIKQTRYKNRAWKRSQATWLPNTDDKFVTGSFFRPRTIDIFNNRFDNIYSFKDLYLNSYTHINIFHPSLPVLAGCNHSGRIHIFS